MRVRGNYLFPPSVFSRLTILCAILRQLHLLLHIHLTSELHSLAPTSFVVDQLSAGLPLLQYLVPRVPILFYCHYPDLLLARGREAWWKRVYRVPFDALEGWSMGFAQAVAVNSEFTKGVVRGTWPRLERHVELRVVHPCVAVEAEEDVQEIVEWKDERVVLSINRFERKKDIALAIRAFAAVPEERRKGVRLVIAGASDTASPQPLRHQANHTQEATTRASPKTSTTTLSSSPSPPP